MIEIELPMELSCVYPVEYYNRLYGVCKCINEIIIDDIYKNIIHRKNDVVE